MATFGAHNPSPFTGRCECGATDEQVNWDGAPTATTGIRAPEHHSRERMDATQGAQARREAKRDRQMHRAQVDGAV